MEALALSVAEACQVAAVCRTTLYYEIRAGRLRARRRGRRVLIVRQDLERWLKGLPLARPTGRAA